MNNINTNELLQVQTPKKKYYLHCYNNGSYIDALQAIASGGNWKIESFLFDTLTIEMLNDEPTTAALNDANLVRGCLAIANNAMDVFGHLEDTTYFITNENDEVVFYQDDSQNGKWMETTRPTEEPKPSEQLRIPVTVFITIQGKNLLKNESELRLDFVNAVNKVTDEITENLVWADADFHVVEYNVQCTEQITYHEIK